MDPRSRHPDFTPTDPPPRPKRELPGIPTRKIPVKEKPVASNSIAPAVIAEAKSTRFQVSLFLVLALMAGTYYLGRESGKGVSDAQMRALTSIHDQRLQSIARSLEAMSEMQKSQGGTLIVMDGRIQGLNGQVEVVKSKVDDLNRRH